MAQLLFFDECHKYTLDGEELPSVSQLTRFISREIYGDVGQFNLDRAAERGTAVHKATERIITSAAASAAKPKPSKAVTLSSAQYAIAAAALGRQSRLQNRANPKTLAGKIIWEG